jgi:hypothetical protein
MPSQDIELHSKVISKMPTSRQSPRSTLVRENATATPVNALSMYLFGKIEEIS